MFKFLRELFGFKKEIKSMLAEYEANQSRWIALSSEEFALLPDDELFDAALARTENEVDEYEDLIDGIDALGGAKRIFYVASYYEMEVNNGGLCQFFVNSSRHAAPELSFALEAIGAFEHKRAYDEFVQKNNINTNDLSSFDTNSAEEFEAQTRRYPFEQFDKAFYDMKPIRDYLTEYVKENKSKF